MVHLKILLIGAAGITALVSAARDNGAANDIIVSNKIESRQTIPSIGDPHAFDNTCKSLTTSSIRLDSMLDSLYLGSTPECPASLREAGEVDIKCMNQDASGNMGNGILFPSAPRSLEDFSNKILAQTQCLEGLIYKQCFAGKK